MHLTEASRQWRGRSGTGRERKRMGRIEAISNQDKLAEGLWGPSPTVGHSSVVLDEVLAAGDACLFDLSAVYQRPMIGQEATKTRKQRAGGVHSVAVIRNWVKSTTVPRAPWRKNSRRCCGYRGLWIRGALGANSGYALRDRVITKCDIDK